MSMTVQERQAKMDSTLETIMRMFAALTQEERVRILRTVCTWYDVETGA